MGAKELTDIERLVCRQRKFFRQGKTFEVAYRRQALKRLYRAIEKYETRICSAMYCDLGKSEMEARMCEIRLTLSELSYVDRHVEKWAAQKPVPTPLGNFPAKSFTVQEPYGVVLVMAPWNYPFLLCMEPLIGAVAAGNCCIVKPSAYAPATSRIVARIIREVFEEGHAAVVEGGRAQNQELLEQRFDYIFFTGSVSVGKLVMEKAARHLTPVSLELGGKSPCIVDSTADLKVAARRLAFGKFLNCGQTCVAPDYLLIDEKVKEEFLGILTDTIREMYGEKPLENEDYGNIVNRKHFERILGLMDRSRIIYGGACDAENLHIEPTIMDGVKPADAVMGEEIFGPLLPVLTFRDIRAAEDFVRGREKPLALYLFTSDKTTEQRFLKYVSFGGGCINDTVIHLATSHMGFGGVGSSGMGSYHGKKSFDTFSHEKSMVKKYTWLDLPIRYQPYRSWKEKVLKMVLR